MPDQKTTPQPGDPAYTDLVRQDFDRLAAFDSGDTWNHNNHYHDFLLSHLLPRFSSALDVGCGTGAFACRSASMLRAVRAHELGTAAVFAWASHRCFERRAAPADQRLLR